MMPLVRVALIVCVFLSRVKAGLKFIRMETRESGMKKQNYMIMLHDDRDNIYFIFFSRVQFKKSINKYRYDLIC